MKKKIRLDKEEQALEKSFGSDKWLSVSPSKKIDVINSAKQALIRTKKDIRTNIRLSKIDIDLIRSKAQSEGIPYQTLISSIVHKYATDQFVDRTLIESLSLRKMR